MPILWQPSILCTERHALPPVHVLDFHAMSPSGRYEWALGVCTDTEGLLGITTAGSHGTLSTSFPNVFSEDLTALEAVTFQGSDCIWMWVYAMLFLECAFLSGLFSSPLLPGSLPRRLTQPCNPARMPFPISPHGATSTSGKSPTKMATTMPNCLFHRAALLCSLIVPW